MAPPCTRLPNMATGHLHVALSGGFADSLDEYEYLANIDPSRKVFFRSEIKTHVEKNYCSIALIYPDRLLEIVLYALATEDMLPDVRPEQISLLLRGYAVPHIWRKLL